MRPLNLLHYSTALGKTMYKTPAAFAAELCSLTMQIGAYYDRETFQRLTRYRNFREQFIQNFPGNAQATILIVILMV